MAKLDIVEWPAKVLETRADEVTVFDEELRTFVRDMHETMDAEFGIGLAANQVGILKRLFVIYIPWEEPTTEQKVNREEKRPWHGKRFVFINPEIVSKSGKIKWVEGCLSFPEVYDYVDRAANVTVKAFDEYGKEFTLEADGLLAVCIQHELDHVDGVVFFQRMSRLKASSVKKKMQKRQSQIQPLANRV